MLTVSYSANVMTSDSVALKPLDSLMQPSSGVLALEFTGDASFCDSDGNIEKPPKCFVLTRGCAYTLKRWSGPNLTILIYVYGH